mmetsp:Transcript_96355/g.276705  ORF Transcript_96355/g.276705 Transcript_96355/m.276705 type:complete len:307 (-) Transcript_96355:147-1067(-)
MGCGDAQTAASVAEVPCALMAAISAVRLGKLGRCTEESFVIDTEDDGTPTAAAAAASAAAVARPSSPAVSSESGLSSDDQSRSGAAGSAEEVLDAAVIEDDLSVEDFDAHEAMPHSVPLPPTPFFGPNSTRPLRLMQARAQQCVVCMEDREHTFVPPHLEEASDSHVQGHRFCTDCWVEYLYHCSRQPRRRGALPANLSCPLCRGGIHAPDVWGATYDLPPNWMGEPCEPRPLRTLPSAPAVTAERCSTAEEASASGSSSEAESEEGAAAELSTAAVRLWAEATTAASNADKSLAPPAHGRAAVGV